MTAEGEKEFQARQRKEERKGGSERSKGNLEKILRKTSKLRTGGRGSLDKSAISAAKVPERVFLEPLCISGQTSRSIKRANIFR